MTRLLFWLALALSIAIPANGQLLTGVTQVRNDGAAPGGCSNSLDFTQACNSQYITVIIQ